tara:strand:- start:1885 stop:2772 length:888 start_codon:yes stop_codon:yes gene_type:complete
MLKLQISNPIFKDLIKLKLIERKNLKILFNKTRDKKIRVLQDRNSKIIFLEKNINNKKQYIYGRNKYYLKIFRNIKNNKFLDDDKKRFNLFKKEIKNKKILDYGCGFGGFISLAKKISKVSEGFEMMKICQKYIRGKKLFKLNVKKLDLKQKKFDTIFLFHVLEHMSDQLKELKYLKSLLNKNGKLIIEVPHSKDILISNNELNSFKEFTFWSEHLILHTKKSLKKFLIFSGFKKVKFINYQRYNLDNHLNWLIKNRPNGHINPLFKVDIKTKKNYEKYLFQNDITDTLVAVASK